MADRADLSLALRLFLKTYPWRTAGKLPARPLAPPLAEARLALVSTAGFVPAGEPPFAEDIRGGDFSHRVIPAALPLVQLSEHHRSDSFDHTGIGQDRNLALPLERLAELVGGGEVGAMAPRHVSLMGSITAPGRLLRETVPHVVDLLLEDRVDAVLLVPV